MAAKEELINSLRKNYDRKLFSVEVLSKVFGSLLEVSASIQKPLEEPNNTEKKVISEVGIYGKVTLEDGVEVLCYEILLRDQVRIDQSKVAIQHYVRKLLTTGQAALVNFISPMNKDMWRFTLVAKDSELTKDGIAEKVTHPKRYTYLIETGSERRNRTLAERLESLSLASEQNMDALKDAFSVEKMSKAFFDEYKEHYQNFVQYLTGKRMMRIGSKWQEKVVCDASPFLKSVFNGNEKNARDFCKKLLGRIIFLYFVQKKRWLGASSTEYEDGSQNFIYELFLETGGDEKFFPLGLTELFFNALNRERSNDDYITPTGRSVKIPYLNGGLFTRDEIDELLHKKGDLMTFPKELFSNPEKNDIPLPKGVSLVIEDTPYRGFLDFLNAFNFTVYEDGQDDHTVAVDPEMLGHIFENLLEDNKDKGAFYTPKEIVTYMCQESLIEYLKSSLESDKRFVELEESSLQDLIREKEAGDLKKSELIAINEKLDSVKICDPAIGSGAFPMGLLQEVFNVREIIAYEAGLEWDAGKVKEDIIQNAIYGVDIEKGAVDIARLRFWLSLVVDKEKPKALPNLDYKIVVGDSLLSKVTLNGNAEIIEIDWSADTTKDGIFGQQLAEERLKIIQQINEKQVEFFHPNAQNKEQLKSQIRDLKIDLLVKQLETMVKTMGIENKPVEQGKKANQQMVRYLETEGWKQNIQKLKQLKKQPEKSFDHFDWKLDFPEVLNEVLVGESEGFDIVIGNPPYLRVQGIRDNDSPYADELIKRFKAATGSFDLYAVFLEKAMTLINSSGIVNFIMPVKWTNAAFGSGLREVISKTDSAHKIISFGAYQVFNASTYTGLQWFKANSDHLKYHELDRDILSTDELSKYLNGIKAESESRIPKDKLGKDSWVLSSGKITAILNKLSKQPRRMSDIFEKIFQGLATSKDNVYFLYDCKENGNHVTGFSKQLDSEVKVEKDFVKPLLKGDDVHRYEPIETNRVVLFPYKLSNDTAQLYTEKELKNEFPLAYNYLKKCEDVLRDREKGRFNIDGEWFQYGRKQGILFAEKEKLLAPEISLGGNFVYDQNGGFYSTTTVYGYVKKTGVQESYKCLMAILNSRLFWWYLVNTGTVLANGYFRYKPNYIKPFPMPSLIPEKTVNRIDKLIDQIMESKLSSKVNNTGKLESEIDEVIYDLYDLNHQEISIINDC